MVVFYGFRLWFVLSSIVGWLLCIAAVWIVVKAFFKDFDLGEEADVKSAENEDMKGE